MIGARSPWRTRLNLLAVLVALVAANVAVLVAYRGFSDTRVRALEAERASLEEKKAAAEGAIAKLDQSVARLAALEEGLDKFYGATLGSRKERLAPLIEEIHEVTKKAGLLPDAISYSEEDEPGSESIHLAFRVTASYPDVKRLLAAFETSGRFLVVDSMTIGVDESGSDLLNVGFVLSHYFRETGPRRRRVPERAGREVAASRTPAAGTSGRSTMAAAPSTTGRRTSQTAPSAPMAAAPPPAVAPARPEAGDATASTRGGGLLVPRVGTAPGVASAPRPRAAEPAAPAEDAGARGPGGFRERPRPPRKLPNEPTGVKIQESGAGGGPGAR